MRNLLFKLGTGADLTTIKKSDLQLLGYTQEWIEANLHEDVSRKVSRAGGTKESAFYVIIPVANILGRELRNWPFYIRKEVDKDYPNLLGINILSHFNFTFDYDTGFLLIDLAKNPIIRLPLFSGQEIGDLIVE
jgi:hypothetical protein